MEARIETTLALLDAFSENLDKFRAKVMSAAGPLNDVQKKTNQIGESSANGFGKAALFAQAAWAGIQRFSYELADCIRSAAESETANVMLADSMSRIGSATPSGKFIAYLEELSDRLNVSNDSVKRGATDMLRTGKVTESFVAQVMKGLPAFAAMGVSVEQSSSIISQALQGNTRGLKQFNIVAEDTDTISQIIEKISTRMREMEAASIKAAESPSGKFKGLVLQIEEVKTAIGAGFLSAFAASEASLRSTADTADTLGKSLGTIARVASGVGGLLALGTTGIATGVKVQAGLFASLAAGLESKLNGGDFKQGFMDLWNDVSKYGNEQLDAMEKSARGLRALMGMGDEPKDKTDKEDPFKGPKATAKALAEEKKQLAEAEEKKAKERAEAEEKKAKEPADAEAQYEKDLAKFRDDTENRIAKIRNNAAEDEKAIAEQSAKLLEDALASVSSKFDAMKNAMKALETPAQTKRRERYEADASRDEGRAATYDLKAEQASTPEEAARYRKLADKYRGYAARKREHASPLGTQAGRQANIEGSAYADVSYMVGAAELADREGTAATDEAAYRKSRDGKARRLGLETSVTERAIDTSAAEVESAIERLGGRIKSMYDAFSTKLDAVAAS